MYNFGVVMTEEEKKLLNTFETRLRHLLYLHDELKRENVELKKLLDFEKLKNEKIQAQYDELEVNYTNLKTATAISLNGGGRYRGKKILCGSELFPELCQ